MFRSDLFFLFFFFSTASQCGFSPRSFNHDILHLPVNNTKRSILQRIILRYDLRTNGHSKEQTERIAEWNLVEHVSRPIRCIEIYVRREEERCVARKSFRIIYRHAARRFHWPMHMAVKRIIILGAVSSLYYYLRAESLQRID